MTTSIIAEPSAERNPLPDDAIIAALWPDLTCCGQVWSGKHPTPPPVGKPQEPPRPPTAWEVASEYCFRLGLAYDRANEIAAALWADADRAAWRRAVDVADALFNDYAAADRDAARLLVPGLWRLGEGW